MTDLLFIDLETRSAVDLPKRGAHVYYESDTTDVLMACWAIGDGEIHTWLRGDPVPPAVRAHIEAGGMVSGWNVFGFERLAFNAVLGPRYGWPVPKINQYTDTQNMAQAMTLPASLGKAAEVLGLSVQKDKDGMRLIRKFSLPRKDGAFNEPEDHPEDFAKFVAYCRDDVAVERAARARLIPLSDDEQAVAVLDATINDRGLRVDRASAAAAVRLAEKAKRRIDAEIHAATGGAVRRVSEVAKILAWVNDQGVALEALDKGALDDVLHTDIPAHVRHVLELRLEGGKTSVTKIEGFLKRAGRDGRIRGCYSYHGANTGRWASTGVNVSNLPRPRKLFEDAHPRPDVLFNAFRQEDPDLLLDLFGPDLGRPMHLLSDAVRGFLWAGPGKEFVQADYSGIEGAVIAWLANEEWKLKAMHEIIADPALPDMYRQTAARILNLSTDVVTKKHWGRQAVGKTSELALGYGGGASAFISMANLYRVDLDSIYPPVWANADDEVKGKVERRFEFCFKRNQSGARAISKNAWMACEIVKRGWREQNSAIAKSWHDAESAAREALQNPGTVHHAARCDYIFRFGYLWMRLPSGRTLAFASPRLSSQVWVKVRVEGGEYADAEVMDREKAQELERKGHAQIHGDTSPAISFCGVDSVTKKWVRKKTYGGDLVQSATQATARDILVNGMRKAEAAGYPVVLHTYDEMACEVPKGFGDLAAFERLICELPEWAAGMPLTAGGFRAKRYKKD